MFEEKCLTWKVLILPSGFFCSLIYLYLLYKERYVIEIAEEDWQLGFLNFSFESFRYITSDLIEFFFGYYPERGFYVLLFLVVFMSGFFLLLLTKRKESFLLLLTSCLILLVSFFRIYPITNRVALFIFPFCILAIGKLIDVEDFEKKTEIVKSIVLSFFTILILQAYTIPFYGMNNPKNYWMTPDLRTSYKEISEEILSSMSNGDILYSHYSNYVFFKYYSLLNINKVDFIFYDIGNDNPINTLNIDEFGNLLSKMDKSNKLYLVLAKEGDEYVPSEEVEKYLTQNKTYLYSVFENEFFKMYKIYKK